MTYFVHATSEDNEARISSGWSNPSLSQLGLQQARELRQLIEGRHFDIVFTSDLRRAVQTAEIAFPKTKIVEDARLREMNYRRLNGKSTSVFPNDNYWCIENRFEEGECCLDVQERTQQFLLEHDEPTLSIAVVSHRYPQLAFEVICNKLSWRGALDQDWRTTGAWQPGWEYGFAPN